MSDHFPHASRADELERAVSARIIEQISEEHWTDTATYAQRLWGAGLALAALLLSVLLALAVVGAVLERVGVLAWIRGGMRR